MHVGDVGSVEIIAVNESVVDNHRVISPSGMPAPASPSAPTAAEINSHRYTDTKTKKATADESDTGPRIVPMRIREENGRSPDVCGIVLRHVDHFRAGGLDFNDGPAAIVARDDLLLRRRGQLTGLLRSDTQALDRVHHVALLGQERISEICGPGYVLREALHQVRKNHQGLNAWIPILLRGGLGQSGAGETGVLLNPLGCLHELEWICGRHQDLAEQRIRI